MQPKHQVAEVLQRSDLSELKLNIQQEKTLRALSQCRTAALGGHVDACDDCGNVRISYNSCRNRHCPKCQGHKREQWVSNRAADLLPCSYYHLVFTLPSQLNALTIHQPKLLYDILFASVWATLSQFAKTQQMQMGMIAVLHTWGQNLSLHPHLHCIVPGGGLNKKGQWQKQKHSDKYLYPVKALSKVFRAKFVQALRSKGVADQALLHSLFATEWVVYAKRPFGGPMQVIEYLGRYTHKVAISNHRIKAIDDQKVVFSYKDYKDSSKAKEMSLRPVEFVRRFVQHILPHRFVRIRHYGIISSSWKRGKLQSLQRSLDITRPSTEAKTLLRRCPCCKTGTLITIEIFGQRGPPALYLMDQSSAPARQG